MHIIASQGYILLLSVLYQKTYCLTIIIVFVVAVYSKNLFFLKITGAPNHPKITNVTMSKVHVVDYPRYTVSEITQGPKFGLFCYTYRTFQDCWKFYFSIDQCKIAIVFV